mmetsp:Transcript_38384/g.87295  ORF Transcript_38384/g.87295 Transcript_38384/m.87295 type:complete len:91 (+) Transcript_38384:440-712(+)
MLSRMAGAASAAARGVAAEVKRRRHPHRRDADADAGHWLLDALQRRPHANSLAGRSLAERATAHAQRFNASDRPAKASEAWSPAAIMRLP